MGGHPNLRKHSFKNYSSGKKGTIFLGGPSNLKKRSFQNYSSGKKGTIFLGWPPNLKERNYIFGSVLNVQKNSFKNYSFKKRGKTLGRLRNMRKCIPKDCSSKQRNFFLGAVGGANLQKRGFKNHRSKKSDYIFWKAPKL